MTRALRAGLRNGGLRRGGLRPGLGGGNIFALAPLDLQFARQKILDPRVTFTRASSGTYVDSQGVIQRATTNLLLRSEEFNDAVWGKVGGSLTANAIAAPDGQTTADLFTEDTGTGQHDVRVTSPTLADATTYTFSVYARTNGRQLQIIYPLNTSGHGAVFNLSNGTFTLVGNTVSASIALVGNGWYRCTCTSTKAGGSGTSNIRLLTNNGTTNNYTGDGTSGFYLWGAQLEQSSTVGEYIPTTSTINSAPRFDHNPTTGESLGLLVEEQRTNLLLQSEDFSTTWSRPQSDTITTNSISSPAGTATADSFVENSTASSLHTILQDATITANATYTASLYFKAALRTAVQIKLSDSGDVNGVNGIFDLSNGTFTSGAFGTGSANAASIQALPNGWYRCVLTGALGGSITTLRIRIRPLLSGSDTYTGSGQVAFYLWGAQLEAGSSPTSYIPTTTAAVTRSADVASITGSNFSSWYRQSEGTVYWEGSRATTTGFPDRFRFSDGTNANRWFSYWDAANNSSTFEVITGSASQAAIFGGAPTLNVSIKTAFGFAVNNVSAVYGGNIQGTDTSVSLPTISQVTLCAGLTGHIRRLTYWPQRLPNSTLQAITQ